MGLLDALTDPEFRANIGGGVRDALNRGVASSVGGPVDLLTQAMNIAIAGGGAAAHKLGLINTHQLPNLVDNPVGGSEWIGQRMQDAGYVSDLRNPAAEFLAALALPSVVGKTGQAVGRVEQAAATNMAAPTKLNKQAGVINFAPEAEVNASSIKPLHKPENKEKLEAITNSMRESGWSGRPLLVYQKGSKTFAVTGSHRLAAAKQAGINVPIVSVNKDAIKYEDPRGLYGDFHKDVVGSGDDRVQRFLEKAGDARAAELMRIEDEGN